MVGKQKVILRKARTVINSKNYVVLSFPELMNDLSLRSLNTEQKSRIADFINSNGITNNDILTCTPVFPNKVLRNLIESETIFSVTQ